MSRIKDYCLDNPMAKFSHKKKENPFKLNEEEDQDVIPRKLKNGFGDNYPLGYTPE